MSRNFILNEQLESWMLFKLFGLVNPKKNIPFGVDKKREIINTIALSQVPKVGCRIHKKVINHLGSATNVLNATTDKLKLLGLNPEIAKSILQSTQFIEDAERIYNQNKKLGIEIIPYESEKYPRRLRNIHEPPKILYSKGNSSLNSMRIVSVVGARNASNYGIEWVKNFVKELKAYNVTVVSGLAYGIDFHAHKTALEEKLETFAVMAGGLDKIYPNEHLSLSKQITNQGRLISENNVGTTTGRHDFPVRNRIIVGVCDAVVVAEAGEKSGAIITAQYANAIDRDVFALPGNVNNTSSVGCNELIRDHQAHLLTCADQFAFMMGWRKTLESNRKTRKLIDMNGLTIAEKEFLSVLDRTQGKEVAALDVVHHTRKVDMQTVSQLALKFQKRKILQILPGNRYKLTA